jgi:rod shape-determining protein MreC
VVVLVFVALALITIAFRSPTSGPLHSVQGAGSTALRPFQVAATRVAQPFRDGYDYLSSLSSAKSQLKHEKALYLKVRNEAIRNKAAAANAQQLEKLMHFVQGPRFPTDYNAVSTAVISPPSGAFAHSLVIAAGTANGVRMNSPVVSGDGLVGIVSNVFPHSAKVTLLTDPNSFVAAIDLKTRVRGMVHTGPSGTLILDQVAKNLRVKKNDPLVTAGTRTARYPDLYPAGIPIGRVTSVGAADTAVYLQVQVQPFANLGSLPAVAVLVPKKPHR